jgi:hypothetical protein
MAKEARAKSPEAEVQEGDSMKNGASDNQRPGGSVGGQVSGMVDSAKQAAGHALDQAKSQASTRVDQQRQTLVSGIQTVAQAFQSLGKELGSKDEGPVAKYAAEMGTAIGGQVEQLANYLKDRDVHQLISETENFARRSPAVFLGSAFVLGLAASRFLKSSRPSSDGGTAPKGTTGAPGSESNIGSPQLALPPASVPSSATTSSLPSGFPFNSPETPATSSAAQPEAMPNTPSRVDPFGA